MRYIQVNILLSSVAALAVNTAAPASAQVLDDVFNLGEITVLGSQEDSGPTVGGSVVTREQTWTFEKNTLEQAVNLAPGVNSAFDANGRRNESNIYVRGFGRWQVPLSVDGVRVYLPADNRLDFSRFLTGDIAEIQIQKGYASVLDGPGAMGGAINLVSRKPTKPHEAEFHAGTMFGNDGAFEGWNGYARLGTRQEKYYAQASFNYFDRDFWTMSDKYQPPAGSHEDGGARFNSDNRDWRLNLKVGYTPNETDEYTINYIRQEGKKSGLFDIYYDGAPTGGTWRWPWWNIDSLAFLTNTQLGEKSYLKTKTYYNTFDNALFSYDDTTYTTQDLPRGFRSYYEDHAYGTSIEAGTRVIPNNTLKGAFHYRVDSHTEWSHNRPTHPILSLMEPEHTQSQTTWSVALENTFHATPNFDIVAGVSYEKYQITKAQEFNTTDGIFERPKGGADAFNWQAAAIWRYSTTGQLHASVSDRARFPVIFELYSTRFGTAVPNPDLGPERATNYEIGWKDRIFPNTHLSGAVFYSDVKDLIQTVQVDPGPPELTQTQNVGDGRFYGIEVAFDTQIAPQLKFGGNYTYIHRTIKDAFEPDLRPVGVPTHKTFLYLAWQPIGRLTITPSVEIASARWSDVRIGPDRYALTGAYTLVNVQAEYKVRENFEVAAGVRNLLDQNYELAWGYPQQGRNYYFKAKSTF